MRQPQPQHPQKPANWWSYAYLVVLAVGIPAAAYHLYSGRYPNALMAIGAVTLGGIVYVLERRQRALAGPITSAAPPTRSARFERLPSTPAWLREPRDSAADSVTERITGGIVAGFAATLVMALAIFPAYMLAAVAANEHGNQLTQWFWGLAHNKLTDNVFDIPIGAISLNLAAGLAWAVLYTLFIEPRLSGPGWRRGLLFALVPWLLSLVVFFPLAGAGFFGASLHAGPLPALGNLVLHLLYGATLGAVYCLPEVNPAEERDGHAQLRHWENEGIAFGLLGGLVAGVAIGAALSVVVSDAQISLTYLLLVCGGLGCAIGGAIGPFVGEDYGRRHGAV
jgi:hypothetical protein